MRVDIALWWELFQKLFSSSGVYQRRAWSAAYFIISVGCSRTRHVEIQKQQLNRLPLLFDSILYAASTHKHEDTFLRMVKSVTSSPKAYLVFVGFLLKYDLLHITCNVLLFTNIIKFISFTFQRQVQRAQVYGGKTSVRGATSGTASSVAFTPLQVWSASDWSQEFQSMYFHKELIV